MKIIDVGVVLNNVDPKGVGRVRYRPVGQFNSPIENAMPYDDWTDNDQYIAAPFLPPHINVIPRIGQSIKIIKYDTDRDTQNVEYIAGPYATPHDFKAETYTTQHRMTTFGSAMVKHSPDIKDQNGKFIRKESEGALIGLDDTGINGYYGSDLIFTDNGLILRGGKFYTKLNENKRLRSQIPNFPILSPKISKLALKKFPKVLRRVKKLNTEIKVSVSNINYLIEYELDNLESPQNLLIYTYKILKPYTTNKFDETTEINITDTTYCKLINDGEATPTVTIPIDSISSAASELRYFLSTVDDYGLAKINPKYPSENIHPFYFRPSNVFKLMHPTSSTGINNKKSFISSINIRNVGINKGYGLIFSILSANAPVTNEEKYVDELVEDTGNDEQTFGSMTSDKIYLISTSTNDNNGDGYIKDQKTINFNSLNQYEYTQDDYLDRIEPNTYALVRGEVLINILEKMYELLDGHKHNIGEKALYKESVENELSQMIESMRRTLINGSIRIN